jgi:hypothetical protein
MPRYSTAYGEFVARCDEVLLLVRRAAAIERSKRAFAQGNEIDALCRGALVLLSSHIEAYVKELGECLLDAIFSKRVCRSKLAAAFFYHASKASLDRIRDGSEPDRISSEVFDFIGNDADIWSKSGELPRPVDAEQFNFGFANPKFEKVRKYLGRFGYNGLKHDINRALRADAVVVVGNLDQIVDVRNAIAHGEASAKKTPSEVRALVKSATIFCRTVDSAFGDWCRTNICPIR